MILILKKASFFGMGAERNNIIHIYNSLFDDLSIGMIDFKYVFTLSKFYKN